MTDLVSKAEYAVLSIATIANPVALEICDEKIDNDYDGRAGLADLSCMSSDRWDDDAREDNDDEDSDVD